jgi:hypothetical protein
MVRPMDRFQTGGLTFDLTDAGPPKGADRNRPLA